MEEFVVVMNGATSNSNSEIMLFNCHQFAFYVEYAI